MTIAKAAVNTSRPISNARFPVTSASGELDPDCPLSEPPAPGLDDFRPFAAPRVTTAIRPASGRANSRPALKMMKASAVWIAIWV